MSLKLNKTCFGTKVRIARSGEQGVVTGFAQHQRSKSPQFFIEYTDGNGCAHETWAHVDELEVVAS